MAFEDSNQRQMFQGNWQCTDCEAEITELPFQPAPDSQIYCRECYAKRRTQKTGQKRSFTREMIQGDWQCSECGAQITQLPFQPAPGKPIYCRECYAQKKPQRY